MRSIKNEDIKIEDTLLATDVKSKLISNNILTLADLEKYSIMDLLKIDDICFLNLVHIKATLNGDYNIHLIGEELIDYSDMDDEKRNSLLKRCDLMIKQRNFYRKKSIRRKNNEELAASYITGEENLNLIILNILKEITYLRNLEISSKFNR